MKTPTIHRNGTAAKDLLDDYISACDALQEAIRMVQKAGPNARDYYVETGAFPVAVSEHEDRLNRLRSVLKEFEALAESVSRRV